MHESVVRDVVRTVLEFNVVFRSAKATHLTWRGQLKLPQLTAAEVMKFVEDVKLQGATGKWCEFTNETESILGMIVQHEDKLWIIKFRGSNVTAEKVTDAFRGFCESLKVE